MSESTNNHGFTTKEMEFLMTALKHADGGSFKFDADAVAKELGYKDGSIARVRWNSINRNKIKGAVGGIDKASPAKKNIKPKKAAGEEDGDDAEKATPKKRGGRKTKHEKTEQAGEVSVKAEAEDDEELL